MQISVCADETVNQYDIEEAFGRHGTIDEIWLASYAPFYAFVKFKHVGDAEDSVRALNNS